MDVLTKDDYKTLRSFIVPESDKVKIKGGIMVIVPTDELCRAGGLPIGPRL